MSAPEPATDVAEPSEPIGTAPDRTRPPMPLRREALAVGAAALAAVVLGVLWAVLAPVAARASAGSEAQVAHDCVFGLLGLLAGVVTAALLARFPGPRPAARVAIVLVAVTAASYLAWAVGRTVRAPGLHAGGMALLWPLSAAAVTAVRSLIQALIKE